MQYIRTMNEMTKIGEIKLNLHRNFYNEDFYNLFSNLITAVLPVFTLDRINNSFMIKIKKTEMKQIDKRFIHTSQYYYPIIDNILFSIIGKYDINTLTNNDYILSSILSNKNNTQLLYNLTTESDNIIIITF